MNPTQRLRDLRDAIAICSNILWNLPQESEESDSEEWLRRVSSRLEAQAYLLRRVVNKRDVAMELMNAIG